MKNKTFLKRILVVTLCLVMVLGAVPMTANAISTSVPGAEGHTLDNMVTSTFKGGYDSTIFVYVTPNVSDSIQYRIDDNLGIFAVPSYENSQWYFEGWKTWYKGSHSGAGLINSDKANPKYDDNENYFTIRSTGSYIDGVSYPAGTMYVLKEDLWKGTYYLSAIFKPIVTVNADNGVSYVLTTNSPKNITSNQTAVKYLDDVTITYEVDEKYVLTGVNASGTNDINIDKANKVVKLNDTEKPTSIGIHARLKQHNVVFDGNGANTGSMDTQVFEHSVAQSLKANDFKKDGYIFTGWNTKADGSGTSYTDGQFMTFAPANDGDSITLYAQWKVNKYTVSFDSNGGVAIDPIDVTFGEKYGNLPSSAVTGLSGGNKNWYLVDENGDITATNIKKLSIVQVDRDHSLFMKRTVLAPTISLTLKVPGGISDGYQYYIPGNSQRVLTVTVGNRNDEIIEYTYQWYKDGTLIQGANEETLILPGNVVDSGKYKVEVTATLKDGTGIIVTSDSASAMKEQNVKILHSANTLYYDANGGEGGPSSSYTGGMTLTVSADRPTRENYIFCGWNTKADGTGHEYIGDSTYTFAQDNGNGGCKETLYAQWELVEYTITFEAENGVYKEVTYKHGETVVMPEPPTKDGYTVEWETVIDTATEDMTIRAIYTKLPENNPPENNTQGDDKPTNNPDNTQNENLNSMPNLPQTGDDSNMLTWVILLLISGGSVLGIIFNKGNKKVKDN